MIHYSKIISRLLIHARKAPDESQPMFKNANARFQGSVSTYSIWLLLLLLTLSACSEKPTESPRETQTCDLGVMKDGACKNPDACDDEKKCLAGYSCEGGTCQADLACTEDADCGGGTCKEGACVNPERCIVDKSCIPGHQCDLSQNKCIKSTCETPCTRGICKLEASACVSKSYCNISTQDTDCIEGEYCHDHECKPKAAICQALGCEANESGVCDVEKSTCVNAENCEGKDGKCIVGYFCDTTECKPNKCETSQGQCPAGGVCEKSSGNCVNSTTCNSAKDCINGYKCLQNSCTLIDQLCGDQCKGNQVCDYDQTQFTASCKESDEGCTNALDCLGDRICTNHQCSEPLACEADALESPQDNNSSANASNYHAAKSSGQTSQLTLCHQDEDWFAFDTRSQTVTDGTLYVVFETAPNEIGVKDVKVELYDSNDTKVASVESDYQNHPALNLTLSYALTAQNAGEYKVRVYSESTSTAPLKYSLTIDVLNQTVIDACSNPKKIELGVDIAGDFSQTETKKLSSSCAADTTGSVRDDIYTFDISKRSFVSVFASPSSEKTDISLSIRSVCSVNTSEIPKGCSDNEPANTLETLETTLDPGTYYVVVTAPSESAEGPYQLLVRTQETTCTSAQNHCNGNYTAEICNDSQTGMITQTCANGCDPNRGICRGRSGDTCEYAIALPATTKNYEKIIKTNELDNHYSPGASCPNISGTNATSGNEAVFAVTVPDKEAVQVKATAVGKTSIYITEDCNDFSGCLAGVGSGDPSGKPETLSWENTSGAEKTVYVMVDYDNTHWTKPDTLKIEINVEQYFCLPNTTRCIANREVQTCNELGSAWNGPNFKCDRGCYDNTRCKPASADDCNIADTLTPGTPIFGNLTGLKDTNDDPGECGSFDSSWKGGVDAMYHFSAKKDHIYELTLKSTDNVYKPAMWIAEKSSCDASTGKLAKNSCVMGINKESGPVAENYTFYAYEAKEYIIVVEDIDSVSGEFKLTLQERTPTGTPFQISGCNSAGDGVVYYNGIGEENTYMCSCNATTQRCQTEEGKTCLDAITVYNSSSTSSGGNQAGDFGGTRTSFMEPIIGTKVGSCHFRSNQGPKDKDIFYRFDLQANDVLTIDFKESGNSTYASAFFQKGTECGNPESCFGTLAGGGSEKLSYKAENGAETIYFIVKKNNSYGTSNFEFDWNVSSSLTCAPNQARCSNPGVSNDLIVCSADGMSETTYTCANGCENDLCLPNAANGNTCQDAIDAGTGGVFIVDTKNNLTHESDSACVKAEGPDSFFKLTNLFAGQIIEVNLNAFETPGSVYIFESCDDIKNSCVGGKKTGYKYQDGATLRYLTPKMGDYYIGVANVSSYSPSPLYLSINVENAECQLGNGPSCSGGVLTYCDNGTFKTTTCENSLCSGNRCATPLGNSCFDAKVLSNAPNQNHTLVAESLSNTEQKYEPLIKNHISDHCLFTETPSGAEKFYSISLQKGDTFELELDSTYSNYFPYLLDGCEQATCLASLPPKNGARKFTYQATKTQTYYVVVDSKEGGTYNPATPFNLNWKVIPKAASAGIDSCSVPLQSYCENDQTLAMCGSNHKLIRTNCECRGNTCKFDYKDADKCSTAPLVTSGFVGAVPLISEGGMTHTVPLPSNSCAKANTGANDAFFRVELAQNTTLTLYTLPDNTSDRLSAYIFSNCNDPVNSCKVGKQRDSYTGIVGPIGPLVYRQTQHASETVYVSVTGSSSYNNASQIVYVEVADPECRPSDPMTCDANTGKIKYCDADTLTIKSFDCPGNACTTDAAGHPICTQPSGDTCFDPIPVTITGSTKTISGTIDAKLNNTFNFSSGNRCSGSKSPGKDIVYEVKIPAGKTLQVDLDSTASPAEDIGFHMATSCFDMPNSCVGGADLQTAGVTETFDYGPVAAEETIYITVDSYQTLTNGNFNLKLTLK